MAIVTISRGTFSGGKAVAEKLAQRLNYPCLSRESLTKEAAGYFGLDENMLNDSMTEAPSILQSDRPISAVNVNYVRSVLLNHVRSLQLIYHGYAGDILLRGVRKMLRVRVHASFAYRVHAAMENHGIGHEDAVKMVQRLDSKRNKWSQTVLGVEWTDGSLYDVAFNLEHINIDSVVDIIEHLVKLDEFTVDHTTTESLEDLILSSNVWTAIAEHKQTWALHVQVAAKKGQVSVYGDVVSRKLADAICTVAGQVEGVTEVTCKINIGSKWLW